MNEEVFGEKHNVAKDTQKKSNKRFFTVIVKNVSASEPCIFSVKLLAFEEVHQVVLQ